MPLPIVGMVIMPHAILGPTWALLPCHIGSLLGMVTMISWAQLRHVHHAILGPSYNYSCGWCSSPGWYELWEVRRSLQPATSGWMQPSLPRTVPPGTLPSLRPDDTHEMSLPARRTSHRVWPVDACRWLRARTAAVVPVQMSENGEIEFWNRLCFSCFVFQSIMKSNMAGVADVCVNAIVLNW